MLDPWLESKGLSDADQVLAYFAVSKLGEPPIDGKTDTNPEGLTAVYGKWASAVAGRLQAGGLSCKVLRFSMKMCGFCFILGPQNFFSPSIWEQHCQIQLHFKLTSIFCLCI